MAWFRAVGLSGTVDADLSIGGTLRHPLGGGKLVVQELNVGRYALGDVSVLLLANDSTSTIQLILLDGQRLVLRLPFNRAEPPTAELRLKKFHPEKWLPQLREKPLMAELTGSVNARFKDFSFELEHADLNLSDAGWSTRSTACRLPSSE